MARPNLKLFVSSYVVLCISAYSSHAPAQQAPKAFPDISPVPGLKTSTPIAIATTLRKGQQIPAKIGSSPFQNSVTANAAVSHGLRYPGDLQYNGGPVVQYATHHSIFVNPTKDCPPNTCWGDPIGFLDDLGRSDMIHIADQYVGEHEDNRYSGGANYYFPSYAPSAGVGKPFTDADMALAAYSVAKATGGFGYNNIYHLFLVPGQDVCIDNTFSVCYSPDNFSTYYFCAYHAWVQDSAGNVALYTVEAYENALGCQVVSPTPNGPVVDATNNVLSHEVFETITDPEGTGWWNLLDIGLFHLEIGDECEFQSSNLVYFDPSVVRLNHKTYAIQPEYDNSQHACATKPN
jgi:hypothetical protein